MSCFKAELSVMLHSMPVINTLSLLVVFQMQVGLVILYVPVHCCRS